MGSDFCGSKAAFADILAAVADTLRAEGAKKYVLAVGGMGTWTLYWLRPPGESELGAPDVCLISGANGDPLTKAELAVVTDAAEVGYTRVLACDLGEI